MFRGRAPLRRGPAEPFGPSYRPRKSWDDVRLTFLAMAARRREVDETALIASRAGGALPAPWPGGLALLPR